MRLTITLFALAITVSVISQAQNKTLQQDKSQPLATNLGSNDLPSDDATCDEHGHTFVTVYDPAGETPADRPLLMFDDTGLLKTRFASSRKDLNLSRFEDHFEPSALLLEGGVARLAWYKDGMTLSMFSADGKLLSRTKLDPPAFIPFKIAVFPSGDLLVSGLENVHSRRALGPFKNFTALYDKTGHLQKRLYLPGDAEIDAAAEVGDSRYARGAMFGNYAVSGGQIRLGEDGNAYMMRRTSPATVHVISSSGEVLRTIRVEPAEVGQMPLDMQISGGRIAMEFTSCSGGHCENRNITVVDATTGQKLAGYTSENVYGHFVCYNARPERFSFLALEDSHLKVVTAAAK